MISRPIRYRTVRFGAALLAVPVASAEDTLHRGDLYCSSYRGAAIHRQRRSSCLKPSPIRRSSPSRTCGCSKSSPKRWSSRRRRVKSWASSPARRRIFSRCWMPSRRAPRGLCDANDAVIYRVEGDVAVKRRHITGRCPDCDGESSTDRPRDRRRPSDARPADRSTSMILRARAETDYPRSELSRAAWRSHDACHAAAARRRCRSERSRFVGRRFSPSPTSRSRCSKPSPTQAVIAIENVRLVQGTRRAQRGVARGAGASDGDGRGARHHQPLADGRAAGARRHRRERGAGLRD